MAKAKKRPPPVIGTVFSREHRGQVYRLEVVDDESGKINYMVGKRTFPSPSAAAKSIVKNEVNGWVWWRMESR